MKTHAVVTVVVGVQKQLVLTSTPCFCTPTTTVTTAWVFILTVIMDWATKLSLLHLHWVRHVPSASAARPNGKARASSSVFRCATDLSSLWVPASRVGGCMRC